MDLQSLSVSTHWCLWGNCIFCLWAPRLCNHELLQSWPRLFPAEMKLKYKLSWNLLDWTTRKRLSASRRGKSVQEGGKIRPHAMSIYPLSPRARKIANSPYNTWGCESFCNTRSPPEIRGYLACLELPWRLLLSPISPTKPLSTLQQHIAAFSLPLFTAHMLCWNHTLARLCSTKEFILTRFHWAWHLSVLL